LQLLLQQLERKGEEEGGSDVGDSVQVMKLLPLMLLHCITFFAYPS
jgi:hypothetical protein